MQIDRDSGRAVKITPEGEVVELTDAEKEQLSFVVIEILLYIYAKYVKAASKGVIENFRSKIKGNLNDDSSSLPLIKVANTLANKLTTGNVQQKTIDKYIKALAGMNIGGKRYQKLKNNENDDRQQEPGEDKGQLMEEDE